MGTQIIEEEVNKNMLNAKIISICHVKPMKTLGRRECQLVTFDLPCLGIYYSQKLMIYKKVIDFENLVLKLKDGLALVLEEFHQLAGKLGIDEDGVFKVEYDDDMDGVELVVAAAEEIIIAELIKDEGTARLTELVPYNGVLDLEGLHRPLLGVQLTKLKDGFVIGCAFNHAILDGTSMYHFLNSWAQICRGATPISVTPFLDRTKARDKRVKVDFTPPATQNGGVAKVVLPPLREKVFEFPESAIGNIKSKINEKLTEDSKPFSTYQALSTHVWNAVTRARQLKPDDNTFFVIIADCRNRMDPPMPESYFGNLILPIYAVSPAGMLLANPPEFGAKLVQKAIVSLDAKAINKQNDEWESSPKIFRDKYPANVISVGSSPRFKVYELDFGYGGPERVRNGSNNRFDGLVYLYQGKSGGRSVDIDITLDAAAMKFLEKDKEFLVEA